MRILFFRRSRQAALLCGLLLFLIVIYDWKPRRKNESSSSITSTTLVSTTSPVFPEVRPNFTERRFSSLAVEALIIEIKSNIKNEQLAWIFGNCFPNVLDTAVNFDYLEVEVEGRRPDTFITTDDTEAMWLRHSSALIQVYLPLMRYDVKLRKLIEGVILRQCLSIQIDPYANAFFKDTKRASELSIVDVTDMRDGVYERKWALDSLCFVLQLMHSYWIHVKKNQRFFRRYEKDLVKTLEIIVKTMKNQQRFNGSGKNEKYALPVSKTFLFLCL